MEYYGKFGHTLGWIHNIDIMVMIEICYIALCLGTRTVAPPITSFQSIKRCIQCMDGLSHKPIFHHSTYYDSSNFIRLICIWNQVEGYTNQNCLEFHQNAGHDIFINKKRSVSGIIHTLLDVAVYWKVQIKPDVASNSTDGEIRWVLQYDRKTTVI